MRAGDPLKIQDYGVIGDCRAAALIGRNGSLDWLCWPRFDSASIFAALLDRDKGGCWQIAPTCDFDRLIALASPDLGRRIIDAARLAVAAHLHMDGAEAEVRP